MDQEEKQQLRYACLELACRQTKKDEDGALVDLTDDEAVTMAGKFYNFVTKKELN